MAQQISDLNITKTHNKQYILPNSPSEQNDRSQHPIASDHIPKSPSITSQEGEETEKFKMPSITYTTIQIYLSFSLIPQTIKYTYHVTSQLALQN